MSTEEYTFSILYDLNVSLWLSFWSCPTEEKRGEEQKLEKEGNI